ncbi:UPF0183-domain-containing protein [Fomitiporia mediterranea MF3/22]|uniref:UPF0183-domain-containing protein n=1 Tax=Fomitiporia mediterranea (strain MF3/22) TaxID=694068 RepID=UPI0004408982|nr:UPF0183-domain-containing protein [Fomitiporia mediterranea MF3/22]EJD01126.1 UPF0183-domain-containing protein [Fomitiporia mediterranea MF3/22]
MMVSTLDVDLRPGIGLGMFEIGMSLWTVIDLLRHNTTLFPRAEVKYDAASESALSPILLHINPHLDLLFTGQHQRLRTIALRRLADPSPPVTLTYKDTVLLSGSSNQSSSDGLLRRSDVSKHFGPTYPGEGLQYPGVSFLFDDDGPGGLGSHGNDILVGALRVGSPTREERHKEVKRMVVSQTNADDRESDALDEVTECESMVGSVSRAIVKVHDGVILHFYPSSSRPVHIRIGTTSAQDLTCDLGAPLRVYYKEDDRMAIHSRNKTPDGTEDSYFYNYFQYGIDFLLSSSTHLVQKIILHTNISGTPMFQRYQRCPWEIEGEPEDEEDDTPPRVKFSDKFDIISRFLNGASKETMPSMELDRTEDERLTLPSSTTRLIGFDGVVLEVTEAAQVVTVILF